MIILIPIVCGYLSLYIIALIITEMKDVTQTIKHFMMRHILSPVRFQMDKFFLWLSECDGMCEHCRSSLKTKCERVKGEEVNCYQKVDAGYADYLYNLEPHQAHVGTEEL